MDKDHPNYVGHKSCPKCGSKDNVYRYSDGHEYCYGGCGYHLPATTSKDSICKLLEDKSNTQKIPNVKGLALFPEDSTEAIEGQGLTWLKKYGMHNDEIVEHNILWSPSQEQLIFPIYNQEFDVIAWQAKTFKLNSRKYLTFGRMDEILHLIGLTKHQNTAIILVEDLISAIKVSRYFRCLPLFGSACSKGKLARLRRYTDHIIFWLDSDKFDASMRMAKIAAQLGFTTRIIHTEKDPKDHSNEDIKSLGQA